MSTVRTRDISPASSSLYIRSRSRDPSPAESYKGSRFTSSNLKNYGVGNSYSSSIKPRKDPIPYTTNPLGSRSTGLSYLTASEASARISSRRAEREEKKLKSAESEREPPREKASVIAVRSITLDAKPEEMIQVSVVTRGTSPTPPNVAPNFVRPARRIDNAKTIQRPAKRPICADKEIQSDRLDDTSKYSRFKSSRIASWTSFLDNKNVTSSTTPTTNTPTNTSQSGYSRLSNSSSSSKSGNLIKSDSTDSVKKVKSKDSSSSSSSIKSNSSVSKSGSTKSVTKSEKIKGELKSKNSSSTKTTNGSSKQKSPDSSKSLPPLAPKGDSPTKTIISTSDSPKWTNKDFRKSVLNIGPTDRPRKSRASSESETENQSEKSNQQPNAAHQNERSPSVSSLEFSSTSAATTTNSEEENIKSIKIKSSPSRSSFVNNTATTTTTTGEPVNINPQETKTCDQSHDICTNHQPSSTSSSAMYTVSSSQNNVSGAKSSADAKSFLIRTLGPVTNILFKSKSQSSSLSSQLQQAQQLQDTGYNDENNSTSISESLEQDTKSIFLATTSETKFENDNDDLNCNGRMYLLEENNDADVYQQQKKSSDFGTIATHKLRHIDSGDLSSWWCTNDDNDGDEDDDTVANDITLNQSDLSEISETNKSLYKIRHIESGEKAWWMNDSSSKENSIPKNVVTREPSVAKSENREWWLDTTDSKSLNNTDLSNHNSAAVVAPPPPPPPLYRIRHIESGEKAWWMNSDTSEKENRSKVSNKSSTSNSISDKRPQWYAQTPPKDLNIESSKPIGKYRIRHIESGEKAWWMQDNKTEETTTVNLFKNNCGHTTKDGDEPPLGDRASPEGLEDTTNIGRNSPYDNKDRVSNLKKLFISRHTNIDDLLGGSSHPLSPLLLDCFESDEPFEKITPDQVRIHEGTAPGPLDKERLQSR